MNLQELCAWAGCAPETPPEELEAQVRAKCQAWSATGETASLEALSATAEERRSYFEREVAMLKAKNVPAGSPRWKMAASEFKRWQRNLEVLALLQTGEAFKAGRLELTKLIQEKRRKKKAQVTLNELRELAARFPDLLHRLYLEAEADFEDTSWGTDKSTEPQPPGTAPAAIPAPEAQKPLPPPLSAEVRPPPAPESATPPTPASVAPERPAPAPGPVPRPAPVSPRPLPVTPPLPRPEARPAPPEGGEPAGISPASVPPSFTPAVPAGRRETPAPRPPPGASSPPPPREPVAPAAPVLGAASPVGGLRRPMEAGGAPRTPRPTPYRGREPVPAETPLAAPIAASCLRFTAQTLDGQMRLHCLTGDRISFGRRSDNDVVLRVRPQGGPKQAAEAIMHISKVHFTIVREGGRVFISDGELHPDGGRRVSTHGTFLDGHAIERAPLEPDTKHLLCVAAPKGEPDIAYWEVTLFEAARFSVGFSKTALRLLRFSATEPAALYLRRLDDLRENVLILWKLADLKSLALDDLPHGLFLLDKGIFSVHQNEVVPIPKTGPLGARLTVLSVARLSFEEVISPK